MAIVQLAGIRATYTIIRQETSKSMKFAVLGWNFRKTHLEIRERLALSYEQQLALIRRTLQECHFQELVVLSTCNRVEFHFVAEQPRLTCQHVKDRLAWHFNLPGLPGLSYESYDIDAVQHLFRVTASLDSMIVGEPQILGQVKEAYQQFLDYDYVGSFFKGLFPRAFSAAKRIRTETQIAHNAVSISFAAVELAKHIFSDLSQQTVLIIGAGEMAEMAAKYFIKNGVSKLLITNRTFAHAMALAEANWGSAIRIEQLSDYLGNADIVIGSTGAQDFIVTESMVKRCIKRRKGAPMFFIDIAVPRDIDPRLNNLANIYVYDIDDLQSVVDDNRKEREQQARIAEQIIAEEVEKLHSWFKNLSVVPAIRALRKSFHEMGVAELEKTLQKLGSLSPKQERQVEQMIYTLINKILHKPSHNLRNLNNREDGRLYLESLIDLFELEPPSLSTEEPANSPTLKLLRRPKSRSFQ